MIESDDNSDLKLVLQCLSEYVRKKSELKLCLKFIISLGVFFIYKEEK